MLKEGKPVKVDNLPMAPQNSKSEAQLLIYLAQQKQVCGYICQLDDSCIQIRQTKRESKMYKITLQMLQSEHVFELPEKLALAQLSKYLDIVNYRETEDGVIVQARNLKCRLSEMRREIEEESLAIRVKA